LLEGDSLTSITITKEEGVTVGGYALDAIVVAPNYEVAVTKATYNITKATLDVTISFNRNSVIDDDVASLTTGDFTIEYAGWQYTDDESLLDTPVSVDVDAIIATAVEAGEYDILYIAGFDDQYLFNYLNIGTIVVVASEKDVDTTGLTFENKVVTYNGEEQSLYVTWENQPTDVEVRITYSYSKPSRINQGIYTVTASFEVLTAGYKNEIDSMVAILTIKPVEIEIALAPQGSAYGEPIVVNQGSDYYTVISGTVLEKDDLGVNITKSDVMNANHGEYDLDATITNTNYVLTNDPHNVYTISSLDVTVSLRDQIGVYGKSTNISQTEYDITSGALVNESDMVITLSVEYKEIYEVGGSYLITAEIQPNPWYVFSVVDATYTVTARDIEITLNDVNVYYGTEVSAVTTYEITSGELVEANEDLGLTFSITQANKYVVGGDYVISATASNVNYVVSVINAKYIVAPKNVEIIVSDQESVYGDGYVVFNNFELKEGFSLVEGDTKDDLGVRVIVKNPSDNAGEYVLSATINSANYSVKVNDGKYVINKAETILYTDKLLKSYDYTGNAINFNTVNSYVYSNRPASQAGIIKLPTQTVVNAGQYTVTFSINESNNFTSASVEVEIVVNKVAPVVDMTVLLAKTYIYNGAEQEITADKNELVKKADLDEVSLSWEDNRFTSVPEGEKLVVKVTLSETTNYLSKSFTQTVPIRKAEYDFSGYAYAFDSKTVPYDGEHHSIEVVNLPAGISVSYSYNDQEQETPFQFKNAGIYIINAIYSFDEVNYNRPKELISNSYVQIDRINITVNVVDQQGFYGDEPEFDPNGISVIAGNFVSGDPIDLVLELEPRDSYPIGVYKLVANTTSSGNYNVTIASGSYSIIARPITVTIDDRTSQYGDPDVPYSYQITSGELVNNDVLTASLVREEGKLPGEYTISGTVVNPNYAVKVIPGTYTITPRAIVVEVYNQEGTSAKQLNKRAYKTFGKILRGDNLNIQVVGEIGTEPGEYPLTVTYAENPNYSVEIREGIFTLRKVSKIKVSNPIVSKLYDGVPYVFDVSVSSGATPIFSIDGMYVENSFTEVGVYNLSINADVLGDFASPDTYRITFEIRPTELTVEKDGIFFKVTKADGFGAEEKLEVEHDQTLALSGEDYTSKIDAAYSIYIVQGEERISLEEYMQGEEVHIKIKLNETLTEIGAETWFVDSSSNVLHEAQLPDENGYIEVTLADGNHILFVTDRDEATPILVVGSSMALIFVIMGFFFLFRKKFIN
ncbi:MAG: hypothetical protein IKB56_01400, partial [Clostridia bacterium]|nr:hypothetical protein [Clostridia bacterium]